jgi:hypothetical protein
MSGKVGKLDANSPDSPHNPRWPIEARRVVSAVIAFHAAAVLAGVLAGSPSSPLEKSVADVFAAYYEAFDQGYGYRYYAPEPGPTPIVTATVRYADGRPDVTVRLPERGVLPRLRYQRQLALANHLVAQFEESRQGASDAPVVPYARSYARHVARTHPGSSSVALYTQLHLIPHPQAVREAIGAGKRVDLDAEEFYTAPQRIGEFPCDGL